METADEPRSFAEEQTGASDTERQFLVQLNTDDHVPGTESVARQVEDSLRHALRRFSRRLTRVEVFVTDDNAGKSGPSDKRCSIEARPKGGDPVAASHTASTIDEAVAGAAGKLTRALETELGRKQNHKGAESIRGGVEDLP
jgi:ribosome-associated translation inhibitor RaiA